MEELVFPQVIRRVEWQRYTDVLRDELDPTSSRSCWTLPTSSGTVDAVSRPLIRDWERLGRAIKRTRRRRGFDDMKAWASAVGRSTRTLQGLERGEVVGDDTKERIEQALDWPEGRCDEILTGGDMVFEGKELVFRAASGYIEGSSDKSPPGTSGGEVTSLTSPPDVDLTTLKGETADAIRRDPRLMESARAHLLNQYALLAQLSDLAVRTEPTDAQPKTPAVRRLERPQHAAARKRSQPRRDQP